MSKKNVYRPISHLSTATSTELQSICPFNKMLLNNIYVLQKVSSIYRLSIVQQRLSTLNRKIKLNVRDDSVDIIQLCLESKESRGRDIF